MAVVDLLAQFLQTEIDEIIHLKIAGPLALLIVEHDPVTWKNCFRKENRHPVIYVLCNNKAIYWMGIQDESVRAMYMEQGYRWKIVYDYIPCWWLKNFLCQSLSGDGDYKQTTGCLHWKLKSKRWIDNHPREDSWLFGYVN